MRILLSFVIINCALTYTHASRCALSESNAFIKEKLNEDSFLTVVEFKVDGGFNLSCQEQGLILKFDLYILLFFIYILK